MTRRQFVAGGGATFAGSSAEAADPADSEKVRHLLAGRYPPEKLASVLLPRDRWRPFPAADERQAWTALPQPERRTLVEEGEVGLKGEWPSLPATLFLEFVRTGNRSHYEHVRDLRRERLRALVIAECVEAQGRFLDEIVNGIWTTCEESYWGLPAHLNLQKAGPGLPDVAEPTVDLFAAETASLLAWTSYLLGPALKRTARLVPERIELETQRRVLTPNLERNFSWMGFTGDDERPARVNNWDPWICSNWLATALLLERDEQRRRAAVSKILRSLDNFLSYYSDDGGCDEGPSYWTRAGGSLFDCLELLHSATAGAIDVYGEPLIREIGRYIYRVHIHDSYFINFADAPAKLALPAGLVYRFGQRIGDEKMCALGAWAAQQQRGRSDREDSIGRQLPALFHRRELMAAPQSQSLVRDAWFPGIQVMAARIREGSADGLYLAAQGGHNAESHNHNDVGNFIVYAGGEPFIIDVGVETYTAKTFSAHRYEIWTMQSAYHNLPTIGGVMQKDGRQYAARDVAYRAGERTAEFSLDIAGAYPEEARLEKWKRHFRLDRARNRIGIVDDFRLRQPVGPIVLTLMTPCAVSQGTPGELVLAGTSGKVRVTFDANALVATTEEVPIRDHRLKSIWGDRLYRVLLRTERPPLAATWVTEISQ